MERYHDVPTLSNSVDARERTREINAIRRGNEYRHESCHELGQESRHDRCHHGFPSSPSPCAHYIFSTECPSTYKLRRRSHSHSDLRSSAATAMIDDEAQQHQQNEMTVVRAGVVQKLFLLPTRLLVTKSPYFSDLAKKSDGTVKLNGPFYFPHFHETAFAMFAQWLTNGALQAPEDFHAMNNMVALYAIANKLQIEELENKSIDHVREYYRRENMTSPAFRLHYIYQYSEGPNNMRDFLVATAAYRALMEPGKDISESVKTVLRQGGDIAVDFASALVWLVRHDMEDVRRGDPCKFHSHKTTKCSKWRGLEPYEKDLV